MGEIKYTIDETDRRRGGKKSKKEMFEIKFWFSIDFFEQIFMYTAKRFPDQN